MHTVDKHIKSVENWYHSLLEINENKNENIFPMTTNNFVDMVKELTNISAKKKYSVSNYYY